MSSVRSYTLPLYFSWELNIPFIPGFIIVYFSIGGLLLLPLFTLSVSELHRLGINLLWLTLLAGLIFFLVPTRLGFVRESDPRQYKAIFWLLFKIDHPHNLFPSLHIAYSLTIILSVLKKNERYLQWILIAWLAAISFSVLLVHQHHILDIVGGVILSTVIHYSVGPRFYKKFPKNLQE